MTKTQWDYRTLRVLETRTGPDDDEARLSE